MYFLNPPLPREFPLIFYTLMQLCSGCVTHGVGAPRLGYMAAFVERLFSRVTVSTYPEWWCDMMIHLVLTTWIDGDSWV